MILIILFISSFEINKVDPLSALTAPFPLIFIVFQVKLLNNQDKLSLAKGIAMFVSTFFPKLPNQEPKKPPD